MMSCCSSVLTSLPTPPCQMICLFPFFGVKSYEYIYICTALPDCPIPLYYTLRKTHPLTKGSPKLIMNEPWFPLSLLIYTCMWSYIVLSSFMLVIFYLRNCSVNFKASELGQRVISLITAVSIITSSSLDTLRMYGKKENRVLSYRHLMKCFQSLSVF